MAFIVHSTGNVIQSVKNSIHDSVVYLSDVALLRSSPFTDCRLNDVETFHISCSCDQFDKGQSYIGILIYQISGKPEMHVNGRHITAGYVYIKKVENIENLGLTTLVANCMKSLLGDEVRLAVIASGFAYQKGVWKCNSSTYNESYLRFALAADWKPEDSKQIRELGKYEKCALSRAVPSNYMQNQFPSNVNIGTYSGINGENLFA